MGHKDAWPDVQDAFGRYLGLGGAGALERDGASYRVEGGPPCLSRWLYGAASMVLALRCYCEGWIESRRVALESILGEKVPK